MAQPDNAYNDLVPLVKEIYQQLRQTYGDQAVMYRSNGVIDVTYNNRKFKLEIKPIAEEEAEQEVTQGDVDDDVERLAAKAKPGSSNPNSTAAKAAVAKRTQLQTKAVASFDSRTRKLEKALQQNP